jgi:hypothetical protein
VKLPLWRTISGFGVFLSLIAVLVALAPVYIENYELTRYLRMVASDPHVAAVPDETVRAEVLDRARHLHLPIEPGEIKITHPGGKLQVQMQYRVKMNLALYGVDLHFHPEATAR